MVSVKQEFKILEEIHSSAGEDFCETYFLFTSRKMAMLHESVRCILLILCVVPGKYEIVSKQTNLPLFVSSYI